MTTDTEALRATNGAAVTLPESRLWSAGIKQAPERLILPHGLIPAASAAAVTPRRGRG